ncbi:sugar phosphate isomerase/epimerase family protein [Novosphingobium sp.]|jgi:sugar phosphate isomerase/epimerase|uniref:sugar phosphate isomerase/epimerase family protein n=1 Tax=Novosphingobium sp. TaxID=1874826 RepID=UPI003D6CF74C
MRPVSLEFVSTFGLPPVESVQLAARLGYQHVSTVLEPFRESLEGHPHFSLRSDAALRRDLLAAMTDTGVTIAPGEGIAVLPGRDVRDLYAGDLEIMAELGIPRINVVSLDADLARTFDQLGRLSEMAGSFAIDTLIEFVPIFPIRDVETAMRAIRHVGRRDCRLTFDMMHFFRTGGRTQDIAAIDPQAIGYIQLCDAPFTPVIADYMEEAVCERAVPGEGEFPLAEALAQLPTDRVVGIEVPQRSAGAAGVSLDARMAHCLAAARRLLA